MFVFAGLVFTSLSINIHMPILHTVRYTLPVALERRISGDLYQFALHFAPVQLLKQYLDHPSTPLPLKPNKYTQKNLRGYALNITLSILCHLVAFFVCFFFIIASLQDSDTWQYVMGTVESLET